MATVVDDVEEPYFSSISGVSSPVLPPPLKPIERVPAGLSSASSIAPADRRNVLLDLLEIHKETERLTNKSTDLFEAEIAEHNSEIERLETKKQQGLEEEAKAAKARATWSTLSVVAQYISSIGFVVMGASCLGIAKTCLIAAGVIGIGIRVARDTHFLETALAWLSSSKEIQEKWARRIETGALFLEMGLGLAGGVLAWRAGTLAAARISGTAIHEKASSILSMASGVFSVAFKMGSAKYDKRLSDLRVTLREIETGIVKHQQEIHSKVEQMGLDLQKVGSEGTEIQKGISTLQGSID